MKYRCLLFDLDGTLLRSDKTVSPRTLRALEACRERGTLIGICTNRAENRIAPYSDVLKPEVVISNGGALVRWNGKVVFREEFSPAEARKVLEAIWRYCGPEAEITVDGETAHYRNFKADPRIMDKSWAGSAYCDYAQFDQPALKLCAQITDETYPALKAAADIVIGSNDEDGIAVWLEKELLIP